MASKTSKIPPRKHTGKRAGSKSSKNHPAKRNKRHTSVSLSKLYAILSAAVLLASTSLWAAVGAVLQQDNADQLVNSYLFQYLHTFQAAGFPAAHTFLVKWPIFFAVHLLGASAVALRFATVAITLVTVSSLAYILYRIERRPLAYGTLILALASVLALVPPQPYAGALLPVNMAMLATRNIEYIVYIVCLIGFAAARRRTWAISILGMCLLVASDKLFLGFSIGGAVLCLIVSVLTRQKILVRLAWRWLIFSLLAAALAVVLLWAIDLSGMSHIIGSSGGPYPLTHSIKGLMLGFVFAITGIAANFGANPVYDVALLKDFASQLSSRIFGLAGPAYFLNALLMAFTFLMTWRLIRPSLKRAGRRPLSPDAPVRLSLMLVYSSLAALILFVLTDHYWVVDARYLAIVLPTAFIATATGLRAHKLPPRNVFIFVSVVLLFSTTLGTRSTLRSFDTSRATRATINSRNSLVAQAIHHHPVDVLVGDYWRVLPIKSQMTTATTILPLDSCTQNRQVLSSQAWQPDLHSRSFAYLLSFDRSLTDYPSCSLDQVMDHYGRPNQTVLISGQPDHPIELLLIFDEGINNKTTDPAASLAPTTALPVGLDQLVPDSSCPSEKTVMNIVAHQDDDLLFMSPDLLHNIRAGDCVRTIYLTAGDAGGGELYWQGRERGSEAAYSVMLGIDNIWTHRTLKLADGRFVLVSNPKDNPNISLLFFRLPDGHPSGSGFESSRYESLARLESGQVPALHAVDHQSTYSFEQLSSALAELISTYSPAEIHAPATTDLGSIYPDHSDHQSAGRFTQRALALHAVDIPVRYYIGYPISLQPENVSGDDLAVKTAAFLAYSQSDAGVCHTLLECDHQGSYGSYLRRQYPQ